MIRRTHSDIVRYFIVCKEACEKYVKGHNGTPLLVKFEFRVAHCYETLRSAEADLTTEPTAIGVLKSLRGAYFPGDEVLMHEFMSMRVITTDLGEDYIYRD